MCDLEREIGLRLSGRILGVHPFANPNNALAPGREEIGVTGERAICAPQMLLQRERLLRFFDELFKARVAPQRIPERQQFQFAIAERAWAADDNGKLFAGEIFVAKPRSDHRQILDHGRAKHCIFFHGKKLNRALAFTKGIVLSPESGIDQTQDAHCRAVIWLSLYDFLLLRACSSESAARCVIVFCHTSDNAFYEWTIKRNVLVKEDCILA